MAGDRPLSDRLPGIDPRLVGFFEAWRAIRAPGEVVPRREAFDPLAIPELLPDVFLYRLADDGEDFVCRLAGERVNEAWGRSIRGLTLRQIVGERDHPTIRARWARIVGTPALHYGRVRERLSNQRLRRAERLLLPLASADGRIDWVLGVSLYTLESGDPARPSLRPEDIVQIPCAEL